MGVGGRGGGVGRLLTGAGRPLGEKNAFGNSAEETSCCHCGCTKGHRSVHVKTARFMLCEFRPKRKHDPSPIGRWRRPDRPFPHSARRPGAASSVSRRRRGSKCGSHPCDRSPAVGKPFRREAGQPSTPRPPTRTHTQPRVRAARARGEEAPSSSVSAWLRPAPRRPQPRKVSKAGKAVTTRGSLGHQIRLLVS